MGIFSQLLQNEVTHRISEQEKKEELLASPDKMAKKVDAVTEMLYPYSKKPPKLSKYVTKFQGYDEAAGKKGSAMAGFGGELFNEYRKNLAHPDFDPYDKDEILNETARRLMVESRGGKPPRLAEVYQQKLLADTSVSNLFGLTGEDTSVKKVPGEMFGVRSYDDYKNAVLSQESKDEYATGPAAAVAMNVGATALGHVGKQILAKKAAGMVLRKAIGAGIGAAIPLPGAALAVSALMAIPEFKLFDYAANAIGKTDWGKAREGTWKRTGAELITGVAALGAASKATGKLLNLAKAGIKRCTAFEELKRLPDAQKLIEYKRFAEQERVAAYDVQQLFNKGQTVIKKDVFKMLAAPEVKTPSPWGPSGWPRVVEEETPGLIVPPKTMGKRSKEVAEKFAKMNDEMTDIALHFAKRDGIVKGVEKASLLEAEFEAQRISEMARRRAIKKAPKEIKTREGAPASPVDPAFGTSEAVGKKAAKGEKDLTHWLRRSFIKERHELLKKEGLLDVAKEVDEKAIEAGLQEKLAAVKGVRKTNIPATNLMHKDYLTKDEIKAISGNYEGLTEVTGGGIFEEGADPIKSSLKGEGKSAVDNMFKSIAAIGVGLTAAAAATFLGEGEAEAGVWTPALKFTKKMGEEAVKRYGGKEAYKVATKIELEKLQAFGKVVSPGALEIGPENVAKHISMSGLIADSLEGGIKSTVTRVKSLPLGLGRFLTPHGFSKLFFKEEFSPAVELAHMMSAFHFNSANSIQVAKNILSDVPGLLKRNDYTTIIKAMEPLAKEHAGTAVAAGAIEAKLAKYNELVTKILNKTPRKEGVAAKYAEKVGRLKEEIGKLEAAKVKITPAYQKYLSDLSVVEKDLADRFATARISYAAEDTVDYAHRKWLKGMLNPEEELAVARLKKFHNSYAERLKEAGIDTIEHRPYVQHTKHPAWNNSDAEAVMKSLDISVGDIYPFTKFYHRNMFSQQMVPDIVTNMQRYISDTERRLGWTRFWGKGKENSWWSLSKSNTVKSSTELTEFFQRLKDSSVPHPGTTGNRLANTYSAFEVMRLLAFAPSVAFKHVFKLMGNYSTLGLKVGASNTLDAAIMAARLFKNSPEIRAIYSKFGIKGEGKKKLLDDIAYTYLHQGKLLNNIADLDLPSVISESYINAFDKGLAKVNKPGSIPIRAIEAWDRAVSFNTAMEMAAKRGMTAQQATFGIYNTVLNNNFLSGPLNPSWMQHPKIRALLLFQNTAFKIMERRLITAIKTGKAVKLAWKEGKAVIKKDGIGEALKQLTDVRRLIKSGEHELKKNLIADALGSQRDYFGNSIVRQFVRESLLAGAVIAGGAHLGVDLMPHTFHVPFLVHGKTDPTLAVSPITKASMQSYHDWIEEQEEDREFIVTNFLKNWLGSTRGIPQIANKALRISDNDIPAIYEEGKFPPWIKYLFSVPGRE